MMGSPRLRLREMLQGKSKTLATITLKILCTLMLWVTLEKNKDASILHKILPVKARVREH